MIFKGFELPKQPEDGEYFIKDSDTLFQYKNGAWNRHSISSSTAAVDADDVAFRPFGSISSTNVQSAIQEIVATAVQGGETNTASNLGTGSGVFSAKSGVDLRFKSLVAGTNVSLSSDANSITINAVVPNTGGGGNTNTTQPVGGILIPNFTLNTITPNDRIEFANTNPNGWNSGSGSMWVSFEFVSNNYFAANPNGHMAVVLRNDIALVPTAVFGQGMVLGNVIGAQEGAQFAPTTQLETFANGVMAPNQRYLFPNTSGPESKKLQDGVRYKVILESTVSQTGSRYIRYQLFKRNTFRSAWDIEVDTGDVADDNILFDTTKQGLVFAQVFEDNLQTWSVNFENVQVVWGPALRNKSDSSMRLSKYDAKIDGDIRFEGDGRKFLVNNEPGQFNKWTTVQSSTTNGNTTLLAVPNGTSVNANFFAANKADQLNAGSVSLGMVGPRAKLETFQLGTAGIPPLDISIGGSVRATFSTNGLTFNGASLPIGNGSTVFSGANSLGGSNATALGAGAFNFESLCTIGGITAIFGTGATNATVNTVETATRPLYCYISLILSELKKMRIL